MAIATTVQKSMTFSRARRVGRKEMEKFDAQYYSEIQPATKKELLARLDDSRRRMLDGEYKTDVWALEGRLRAQIRQYHEKQD